MLFRETRPTEPMQADVGETGSSAALLPLPAFASEVNKQLAMQSAELIEASARTQAVLEKNEKRVEVMRGHLRDLQIEISFLQKKIEASHRDEEAERHLHEVFSLEMVLSYCHIYASFASACSEAVLHGCSADSREKS